MALFKVMTWNLENLFEPGTEFGPKTQAKYQEKLSFLARVILNIDPDVLAVQEVGSLVAFHDLVNLLHGCYPHLKLSAHPDPRGIRVGFLSKLVIEETEEILAFPPEGLPKVPGLDHQGNLTDVSNFGRGALRIQVRVTPEFVINFITAHLKSKMPTYATTTGRPRFSPKDENERARVAAIGLLKRVAEATALRVKANELLEQNAQKALIVEGDMNDVENAVTTQILQGPCGSEIGKCGFNRPDKGDDTRLFNLAPCIPEERRYSRIYNGCKELIDHILVSQELLAGQPRKLPVVDSLVDQNLPSISDNPNERQDEPGSDHSPIFATFEI